MSGKGLSMRPVCMRSANEDAGQPSSSASSSSASGSSYGPAGSSSSQARHQILGFVNTPQTATPWPAAGSTFPPGAQPGLGAPGSTAQPGTSSSGRTNGNGDGMGMPQDASTFQQQSYSQYYKSLNASVSVGTQTDSAASSSTGTGSEGGAGSSGATSGADTVAQALARAQEALAHAETSLDGIDKLPSATPPSTLPRAVKVVRDLVIVGGISVLLVASHAFGLAVQLSAAVLGSLGIAWWGHTRKSLAQSGAIAAMVVGTGTLGCSLRFGCTLLAFFFSSSKLTQYKEEAKEGLDESSKKGGQRDWVQVFCNGLVPTILAVSYGVLAGCVDVPLGPSAQLEPWRARLATALAGAFMGYYACCCGDTWASELGPLSKDTPRLITNMRPVRRGTNGGVTLLGLSASVAGGAFIGAVFYAAAVVSPTLWIFEAQRALALSQWRLIPLGLMAGLFGSVLDSVLGATLQYTGYNTATQKITSKPGPGVTHISGLSFLDNNAVNMVSATITAALTALATLAVFGG
eukprot:CAMPEP_0202868094 /NCGR_PEP_ID=MMETSP1391-20130828/10182_1 /ASSEMBLY_ACC=CAM_ASM_000867 /TAXON_ID=1034604 /ORGANISM="Chlamydomonas leiostraca, Strain SAG 11-49" /LENGTH=519 /DNA_ID=CAMNT_0049548209 /DNA_START=350 /DNA_END=1909 /DNA_ORIENTATION=+